MLARSIALTVVLSSSYVLAFPKGHHCGWNDLDIIKAHGLKAEPVKAPQRYPSVDPELPEYHPQRILVDETYPTSGGSFLSLDEAVASGDSSNADNIRITIVWDQIEAGDQLPGQTRPYQCSSVGQQITVISSGATHTCQEADVIVASPANTKYDVTVQRTEFAERYFENVLTIKPIAAGDSIDISTSVQNAFPDVPTSYSDTDLVIIMTARPEPSRGLAGYASCRQTDQFSRCTVGHFNWVPAVLASDEAKVNQPDIVAAERHTALHEIVHILGGMRPGSVFLDDSGVSIMASGSENGRDVIYTVDNGSGRESGAVGHYAKPTTWIITPRVKALVQEHYGCDDLIGMALEDIPLSGGAGAHWEARLMGPEVMSYGSGSGEAYMSDLTFAFLEDTNQYRVPANNTQAGRLVPDFETTGECNETASTSFVDFLFGNSAESSSGSYTPPPPRSAGALRWGREEGCDFVTQSAGGWPERYICSTSGEYGCSPDNRMSAVCSIRSDWEFPTNAVSFGDVFGAATTCSSDTLVDCPLPEYFQYFSDDDAKTASGNSAAVASGTGGYSMAMDFAPVRIRQWNCQDSGAFDEETILLEFDEAGIGDTANFTALGSDTAVEQAELFGGQCRCPECRCFVSSLMEFTSVNFNPTFPRLGLCYRHNCYREDYLQIAVVDPFLDKLVWYKCPTAGGKMFIPSFSGAFHCPDAVEFCRHETITGVKMNEFQAWQLWVLLALILLPALVLLILCVCPCTRECLVWRLKNCCGVLMFAPRRKRRPSKKDEDEDPEYKIQRPPKCPAKGLMGVNIITALIGAGMTGFLIYLVATDKLAYNSSFLVVIAATVLFLSLAGMCASRKKARGVSCLVISYFFVTFFVVCMTIYTALNVIVLQDNLSITVDENWDFFEDALSGEYDENATRAEQVEQVTEFLKDNLVILLGGLGFIVVLFLIALGFAGRIIKLHVLASVTFFVLNYVNLFIGVLLIAAGCAMQYSSMLGSISNLEPVVGPVIIATIAAGVYVFLSSILGIVSAKKMNQTGLTVFGAITAVLLLATLYGVGYTRDEANNAGETVDELSDADLGDLEDSRTREQLVVELEDFYNNTMVSFLIFVIILGVVFVALFLYIKSTRAWKKGKYGAPTTPRASKSGLPAAPGYGGGAGGGGRGNTAQAAYPGIGIVHAAPIQDDRIFDESAPPADVHMESYREEEMAAFENSRAAPTAPPPPAVAGAYASQVPPYQQQPQYAPQQQYQQQPQYPQVSSYPQNYHQTPAPARSVTPVSAAPTSAVAPAGSGGYPSGATAPSGAGGGGAVAGAPAPSSGGYPTGSTAPAGAGGGGARMYPQVGQPDTKHPQSDHAPLMV